MLLPAHAVGCIVLPARVVSIARSLSAHAVLDDHRPQVSAGGTSHAIKASCVDFARRGAQQAEAAGASAVRAWAVGQQQRSAAQ